MAAVAMEAAAAAASRGDADSGDDERPLTALPLFDSGFALYGFADGRLVGADTCTGAVRLKDPELPFLERIFDPGRRELGSVPRFDAAPGDPAAAAAAFAASHLDAFLPAVIPGLASEWPALGRWDLDYFSARCGAVEVQVTLPEGRRRSMLLADYVAEIRTPSSSSAAAPSPERSEPAQAQAPRKLPYLRGWYYERDCPWLAEELWRPGDFHDVAFKDWFKRLPKQHHPDFHWLFLGGAGATTPLHVDPTGTHAWLTQLSGRKRFMLFAPCDLPALLRKEGDPGKGTLLPLDEAMERRIPYLDVVLDPGDTLFVPAFWAHHVECIDESVSLTWNFLGERFFSVVRAAFLAHKVAAAATAIAAQAEQPDREAARTETVG